jgi:hypothetical protein
MDRILARSGCVCLHGCIKLGGWGRPSFSVLPGCGCLLAPAQQVGQLQGRRAARPCPPRAVAAVARAAISVPCRQAWELAPRWRGKPRTAFIASAAPPPPSSAARQGGDEGSRSGRADGRAPPQEAARELA